MQACSRVLEAMIAGVMVLGCPAFPAEASIRFVKSDASGADDGSSWGDAYPELQSALAAAQAGDEIWVAAGVYRPDYDTVSGTHTGDRASTFSLVSGVGVYGGFAGVESSRSQRNPLRWASVLSGDLNQDDQDSGSDAENSYHVVSGENTDSTAVLDGFTITGGNANGSGSGAQTGGGLIVPTASDSPSVFRCLFRRNRANRCGGGLFNDGGNPRIVNCTFMENSAIGNLADGGGVASFDASDVHIINSRFIRNSATHVGGGLYIRAGNCTVTHCTFQGNVAAAPPGGGGIFSQESTTTLTHCIVWDNAAIDAPQIRLFGGTISISYSDVEEGQYGAISGAFPPGTVSWGPGNLNVEPLLTPDGHLRGASACVNAGDPSFVVPADALQDGDGDQRVLGGTIDIGADEFGDADADGLPDWWELLYFGAPFSAGALDDPDIDDLANLKEYEKYSSIPNAPPIHVCNACDPFPDGSPTHPWGTIQAGLDQAREGDTVLVTGDPDPGVATIYSGNGNRDLDYHGESIVVRRRAADGPVAINCEGVSRAIAPGGLARSFAALEGVKIINAVGDPGGGLSLNGSRIRLADCTFENNSSPAGGGMHGLIAGATLDDVTIGPGNSDPAVVLSDSNLRLEGPMSLVGGEVQANGSRIAGVGPLTLGVGTRLMLSGVRDPTRLATTVRGIGEVMVEPGADLILNGDAEINLTSGPGIDCSNSPSSCGIIAAPGRLSLYDGAALTGALIEANSLSMEDNSRLINSTVRLVNIPNGSPGRISVETTTQVSGNTIISAGDRYLRLDPDPDNRNTGVFDNTFFVEVEAVPPGQDSLLELRMQDLDCSPSSCGAGAFKLVDSPGFLREWALEKLEIFPGGKINLTNRQGLVFQNPTIDTPETIYVKTLKMHPKSLLNLGLQRMYYQELVDHNDTPVTPSQLADINSHVINVPLTGFSLSIITMENDTEFDVRVQTRVRDSSDSQPCECDGFCTDGTIDDSLCREGSVTRQDMAASGVMEMKTHAAGKRSASSVAAKGSFAAAADEEVLVNFEYLFLDSADAELVVYLSSDPDVSQDLVEIARVPIPAAGRPGSAGSNTFAVFSGVFPRGTLNFTRGTYVELELRGQDGGVWIDNWDPQIVCTTECGNVNTTAGVTDSDWMLILAESRKPVGDPGRWCLDINSDGITDLNDLLLWNPSFTNLCSATSLAAQSAPPAAAALSDDPLPRLLLAGKVRDLGSLDPEGVFAFSRDGVCVGSAAETPAGGSGSLSNGRLAVDHLGRLHQINGLDEFIPERAGLVRLNDLDTETDDEVVVPPATKSWGSDTVYIGAHSGVDYSRPLADAVFDPDPVDAAIVYIIPVMVAPAEGDPYQAAAQIELSQTTVGDYTLLKIMAPDATAGANKGLLREIEIDGQGQWLFVTSAYAAKGMDTIQLSDDYLFVFDAATGTMEAEIGLHDLAEPIHSPVALMVSPLDDKLYLSSSLGETSSVYRFTIQRSPTLDLVFDDRLDLALPSRDVPSFSAVATAASTDVDLSWTLPATSGFQQVRIQRETVDWPEGPTSGTTVYEGTDTSFTDSSTVADETYSYRIYSYYSDSGAYTNGVPAQVVAGTDSTDAGVPLAAVTAMAQAPASGEVWVLGFTGPSFAADHPSNDPIFSETGTGGGQVFTDPVLVRITWPTSEPASAAQVSYEMISCHDLALPLSALFLPTSPADFDGDGDVDEDDIDFFVDCADGPGVPLTESACLITDLDEDGDADIVDFGRLQTSVSGAGVPASVGASGW